MMKKKNPNRRRRNRISESEKKFIRDVTLSPTNNFLFTLGIIFISQLALLLIMGNFKFQSKPVESFVSAITMTMVAAPLLWKVLVLPFRKLIESVEGKAKREVSERDASLRAVFEFAPVGIARMTRLGRFTHVNHKFSTQIGIPIPELLKLGYSSVLGLHSTGVPHETPDDFKRLVSSGGTSLCIERSISSASGAISYFQLTLCSIKGQQGDLNDVICILVDRPQGQRNSNPKIA